MAARTTAPEVPPPARNAARPNGNSRHDGSPGLLIGGVNGSPGGGTGGVSGSPGGPAGGVSGSLLPGGHTGGLIGGLIGGLMGWQCRAAGTSLPGPPGALIGRLNGGRTGPTRPGGQIGGPACALTGGLSGRPAGPLKGRPGFDGGTPGGGAAPGPGLGGPTWPPSPCASIGPIPIASRRNPPARVAAMTRLWLDTGRTVGCIMTSGRASRLDWMYADDARLPASLQRSHVTPRRVARLRGVR